MPDALAAQLLPPFFQAIDSKDAAAVAAALPTLPLALLNLELPGQTKYQPALLRAVARAPREIVDSLLAAGAQVDVRGPQRRTPLMQAFQSGRLDLAELLIERGADRHAVTDLGTRVYDFALSSASLASLQQHWEVEPSLDHRNQRARGALHFAAENPDPAVFEWVLGRTRLPLDALDASGMRVLDYAGTLPVLQRCLALRPDLPANIVLKNGDSSIHRHARRGATAVVGWMLDQGVDLQLGGHDRNTLLHEAACAGSTELVRLLLARGAKLEARNSANLRPLHNAAENGHLGVVDLLLSAGAKTDVKGNRQFIIRETPTPLYLAVANSHLAVARRLLEQGADPNLLCDSSHDSALIVACMRGDSDAVRLLLKHGASPNGIDSDKGEGTDHFYFPLARARSVEIVELLIAAGADVDARNRERETALHWLAECDDAATDKLAALEALLQHGADPRLSDGHGQLPLARAGGDAAAQLLRRYMQQRPALAVLAATRGSSAPQSSQGGGHGG